MVKLLQRLKIWRELKRLEGKARETPSPTTYVDLGQVYINLGMHDQTLRVSEEGLALFPESKELRKLNNFAKKSHLKGRIKELRAQLNKSPEPGLYRELATVYLGMGDVGAVIGTCEEGIRRFPDDPGTYLVMARARLENFYRDLSADDGSEAVRCLGKVISIDRENARAHQLMAEVLYRIGAVNRAVQHLKFLRTRDPNDFEVEAFYRRASTEARGGDKEDVEQLFLDTEARNGLMRGPVGGEPGGAGGGAGGEGADIGSIRDTLGSIAALQGVQKATFIKGAKALIKGDIKDGKDPFLRLARVTSKAAQRACRRMDLGNFSKGVIDGDFGKVCICCYGDVVASVLCQDDSQIDRVMTDLQDLVARSLYGTEAQPE